MKSLSMYGKKGPKPLLDVVLSTSFNSEKGSLRRHSKESVAVVLRPRRYAQVVFATRDVKNL